MNIPKPTNAAEFSRLSKEVAREVLIGFITDMIRAENSDEVIIKTTKEKYGIETLVLSSTRSYGVDNFLFSGGFDHTNKAYVGHDAWSKI